MACSLDFCYSVPLAMLLQLVCIAASETGPIPDTLGCCRSKGMPEFCVTKLCDPTKPPDEFTIFAVASQCPSYLSLVSQCLADGRNHMPCCKKNAKNLREECLHMCDGTAAALNISDWENYKRYLACLTFNIKPIYGCMAKGYLHAPSPPVNVEILQTGPTFASVSWKPPRKLHQLTEQYRISYWKVLGATNLKPQGEVMTATAKDRIHRLTKLNPDTKYAASVEALGDGEFKSLPSSVVHFVTKGVAPVVEAHHESEQAGLGSVVTFVCNAKIYGTQHAGSFKFFWQKLNAGSGWTDVLKAEASQMIRRTPDGEYEMISYEVQKNSWSLRNIVSDGQLHYITALRMRNIKQSAYGNYRCLARNNFGESSVILKLENLKRISPPASPSNITKCCEREGVQPMCLDSCNSNAALQDGDDRSATMPNIRCAMDVPIVLKCSTAGMNYDACCLAKRVPLECLPFCDGSIGAHSKGPLFACLLHTTNILECHMEAKSPLPHPPSDIKIVSNERSQLKLQWRLVPTAKEYYVYYRRKDVPQPSSDTTPWHRKQSASSHAVIEGLLPKAVYDILIIAANDAGFSGSSKPIVVVLKNGVLTENRNDRGDVTFTRSKRPSQFIDA